MKKSTLKTSALGKLTLRMEIIQRLTIAQLEDVAGGLPTEVGPRSEKISCANTHCTVPIPTLRGC